MADTISALIGNTPLVKLDIFSEEVGASVYAKYEAANPGSSVKDRAALSMINRAEERGDIIPGKTVLVEPTSGNTGIAIAMIGAARGYEVILAMPESMSKERRALLKAYGARLVLTPATGGMAGAVAEAKRICEETPQAWIVGQFENLDNPRAHEETTGPEIVSQLGKFPDYVVTGVGTGGTISGIAHYLKSQGAPTKFFAIEPAESPIIGQSLAGEAIQPSSHGIQGIGANFIPRTLDLSVLSGAIQVATSEALEAARQLAVREAVLAGISSGANVAGIRKFVETHPEAKGSTIVTFAVDTGERYVSTALFAENAS